MKLNKYKELFILSVKRLLYNMKSSDRKIMKVDGYYIKACIRGTSNTISIGNGCYLHYPDIFIAGNDNVIKIGDNCHIGPGCSFRIEGRNLQIVIDDCCSFTQNVHLCAQEENICIHIGYDCMFSNNIIVRTSDSHPISDINSGVRLNEAASVLIGDHVWVAPDSKILKGVEIGSGCIIGSNTVVTKCVPDNCLAVGLPARVVKSDVKWERKAAFLYE